MTRQPLEDELALLSAAVTVDLLLGIPLLGYLFLVRRARLSAWLLLPLVLVSLGIAHLILPAEHAVLLQRLELIVPFVEVALIVVLVTRVRRVLRAYGEERRQRPFASEALEVALERVLGSRVAASAGTVELLMLHYAFTGWFRRFDPGEVRRCARGEPLYFAYHRAAGYPAFLALMGGLLVVESVGLHIMLLRWSEVAAWIVTALSLYGFLWLTGDFHAMRLHPVVVDDETLHVRCGLRWRTSIRRDTIVAVSTSEPEDASKTVNLAALGGAELWIELSQPVTVRGLFGLQKEACSLGVTLEDNQAFSEALRRSPPASRIGG